MFRHRKDIKRARNDLNLNILDDQRFFYAPSFAFQSSRGKKKNSGGHHWSRLFFSKMIIFNIKPPYLYTKRSTSAANVILIIILIKARERKRENEERGMVRRG